MRLADRLRKPVMLGEFGLLDKATRNVVYQQWNELRHGQRSRQDIDHLRAQ